MNLSPIRSSCHHYERLPRKEAGAVAVVVALSLVGLIGAAGLALDVGKLYVAKTELQNSADACALAAARELTGANTNQLVIAEAAGITTGERHNVMFQDEQIKVSSVTFSDMLAGSYQDAFSGPGATNLRFARCEVNRSGIANWFIQILNLFPGIDIGDQTVVASAVATLSPSQITSCAIPVGICIDDVPPNTPVGTWVESVLGPPRGGGNNKDNVNLTGNFMWVDFTPPAGGAAELAELLTGPGQCNLPALGSQVGQAGVISSLGNDWNSRFGIYQGNVNQSDARPDYSGYAYTEINWPSKFNAFSDFLNKRGSNAAYQGNKDTGLNVKGTIKDSTYLKENGEDRRLATAAVVDCDALAGGNTTSAVVDWACVMMLHPINNSQGGSGTGSTRMYLEYLGRSNMQNSPCATNGVPAGPNAIGPMVPTLVR
ncbi:putative Flp pilus-assembly TadE/G-like protein [Nitrosomonas nitrosa]|uniref:Putative Flp pilus-assembly TadE/G-like n=1 Tax=Nitrosomonas nitrosa TaxID=52442 RepID=A0A1I4UUH6_9PROT|nr:pilus assembly protein TadG-related protein [Nitrosomonas nitrosa]MCO6434447.1 pilus assembly protein [Nitrosomonas nitrosa]PTR04532.1 putative Flp pilus-assembly TadE/G-like protein [Nitrosomonas nitrosa]SFM92647.1 Putative Flp pilus-assembly TadE/G-like [Nitrosomonas nitrosa]HNP52001.1 pilus assembly protein TadG-related protein [Nitrosomonas nitrosa]